MIPFARIMTYGNKAPELAGVIKIASTNRGSFVLMSEGNLYYCGLNTNGEAAQGNANRILQWTLVSSDVDDFYAYDTAVILHKKDGTIWSSGRTTWFGVSGSITNILTDRTAWFSTIEWSNIKNMSFCTNGTIFIVTKDNKLYGASDMSSRGVLGNNSLVAIYTLTFFKDNVKFALAGLNDSCYIDTSDNLYSTGWNDQGIHGTGNNTQINVWGLRDTNVLSASLSNNIFVYYKSTEYKTCGNSPNFFGAASNVFRTIPQATLNSTYTLYHLLIPTSSTNTTTLVITDQYSKGVGNNALALGVGSGSASSPTVSNLPIPATEIKSIKMGQFNTLILSNNGKLYCTGSYYAMPGKSTDIYTFIEIDIPK